MRRRESGRRKLVEEKAGGSARVSESPAGRGRKHDEGWAIAGESEAGSQLSQVGGDGQPREGLRAGQQGGEGGSPIHTRTDCR